MALGSMADQPGTLSTMSGKQAARGFTLLEVLVALTIAGLALGSLAATLSQGLGSTRLAGTHVEATRRAQSLLASIGSLEKLAPGERVGGDDRYAWRVRISDPIPAPQAKGAPAFALYDVEASVSWPSGFGRRDVTLRSSRFAMVTRAPQ